MAFGINSSAQYETVRPVVAQHRDDEMRKIAFAKEDVAYVRAPVQNFRKPFRIVIVRVEEVVGPHIGLMASLEIDDTYVNKGTAVRLEHGKDAAQSAGDC